MTSNVRRSSALPAEKFEPVADLLYLGLGR